MFNIKNYINSKDFLIKMNCKYINIINYNEIKILDDNYIYIISNESNIIIKGNLLVLNKLLDNEVLITGQICSIELE